MKKYIVEVIDNGDGELVINLPPDLGFLPGHVIEWKISKNDITIKRKS